MASGQDESPEGWTGQAVTSSSAARLKPRLRKHRSPTGPLCDSLEDPRDTAVSRDRAGGFEPLIPAMRTSGSKVDRGHLGRSPGRRRTMAVTFGRCGCCTFLLHPVCAVPAVTLRRQPVEFRHG